MPDSDTYLGPGCGRGQTIWRGGGAYAHCGRHIHRTWHYCNECYNRLNDPGAKERQERERQEKERQESERQERERQERERQEREQQDSEREERERLEKARAKTTFVTGLKTSQNKLQAKDLAECAICHEVMKSPRSLACLHSFCLSCLETQVQIGDPPHRCVLCRATFSVPAGGVKSLETGLFADSLSKSSVSPAAMAIADPNNIQCQGCDDEEATMQCTECGFLGPVCASSHKRLRGTASHPLIPLDDALSGNAPTQQRIPRCPKHPLQEVNTYCKTCTLSICPQCATEAHSGHHFRPLAEEINRLQDEIVESTLKIIPREEQAKEAVSTFVSSLGGVQQHIKKAEEEMRVAFAALQSELDQRHAKLIGELHQLGDTLKKSAEKEKEEAEFALCEFRGFREFNEGLLTEGTPVEIAGSHKQVQVRAATLEKMPFHMKPSKKAEVKFSPHNLQAVQQAIVNMGLIE